MTTVSRHFGGYLPSEKRQELEDAFETADMEYDDTTRARLLDGVNRTYRFNFLVKKNNPLDQLFSDLSALNKVERLTDGTIPLAHWLSNAARRFRTLPEQQTFEAALDHVIGQGDTSAPAPASMTTPPQDFEEIITDDVDDLLNVDFLVAGSRRMSAVAKLLVPRYENGVEVFLSGNTPFIGQGTGWLIGSDLMLTNWHVIRNRVRSEMTPSDSDARAQALHATAQFFYDAEGQEGRKIPIADLIAFGTNADRDFALLRLAETPDVPILPVRDEPVQMPPAQASSKGKLLRALSVNIIQHPDGRPKRVALRNNLVYAATYPRLHYFTDTQGGSSGAPVFDDEWRVVALHRGAVPANAEFNGKQIGYVNEGIQIHAVLQALRESATLHSTIVSALSQIEEEQAKI